MNAPVRNVEMKSKADLQPVLDEVALPRLAPQVVPPAPKRSLVKSFILGSVMLVALLTAGKYGLEWYQLGRFQVETNDAYVKADTAQVGAKVAGYVISIPVAENANVKAGDVIAKLDDGDYQLAVEAARNRIATQQAVIAGFDSQTAAQQAQVAASKAKLDGAKTEEANSATAQGRVAKLVLTRVVSQQAMDDAQARYDQASTAVVAAKAEVTAADAQLAVIAAGKTQAEAQLRELQTALKRAERDLSFTEVKAPFDGVVANRAVEPGQYVQAGTRLMALVPSQSAYIEANFKETDLGNIHPGQKVEIVADAFSSVTYEGRVESVAPASGAEFSLLPPENATGNFTKITQRYPVHVSLPVDVAEKLVPGLSVTVTVDSRDSGN
jgi:membrane fusion protein, multidrug efflux system